MNSPLSLYKGHPTCTPDVSAAVYPCQSPEPVRAFSKLEDIIAIYQLNDAGEVAKAAKQFVDTGVFPVRKSPPGLMMLYAAFYNFSPYLPIALIMVVIACGLWAAVFRQITTSLLQQQIAWPIATMIPLVMLLISDFPWLITEGVFSTETYAIALFLLGLGKLVQSLIHNERKRAFKGGLLIALSAYMQEQTDGVIISATLMFLCCWLAMIGSALCYKRHRLSRLLPTLILREKHWLYAIGVALLGYHLLTMPYRAMNGFEWAEYDARILKQVVWQPKEQVPADLQVMILGGAAAGCELDAARCEHVSKRLAEAETQPVTTFELLRLTVSSVVHHPLRWALYKLTYFKNYWLDGQPDSMLLTLMFGATLVMIAMVASPSHLVVLFWLAAGAAGVLIPSLVSAIEVRDLYILRFIVFYAFCVAVGTFKASVKKESVHHYAI